MILVSLSLTNSLTKVLLPSHLSAQPAELFAFMRACIYRGHSLTVYTDNAYAFFVDHDKCSSDDINMLMEAVVGFIGKLVDNTVHKTIMRMFLNQKPWVVKPSAML